MREIAKQIHGMASSLHGELLSLVGPPDEGLLSQTQQVLPAAIVRNTRGYLEKTVNQINGSYEHGWYDCCAMASRRLLETVIIETFEARKIEHKIKNTTGDFKQLSDLIGCVLSESGWNLSRNTKRALPRLKSLGDLSAHSRRYTATRPDIDRVISDFRVTIQELLSIAGLK